jgi:hypothetical protein
LKKKPPQLLRLQPRRLRLKLPEKLKRKQLLPWPRLLRMLLQMLLQKKLLRKRKMRLWLLWKLLPRWLKLLRNSRRTPKPRTKKSQLSKKKRGSPPKLLTRPPRKSQRKRSWPRLQPRKPQLTLLSSRKKKLR